MIDKDKSVVSRELKRNCDKRNGTYDYGLAQRKYEKRKKEKPKFRRFTEEIRIFVDGMLREELSPEQIVGRCSLLGKLCDKSIGNCMSAEPSPSLLQHQNTCISVERDLISAVREYTHTHLQIATY